MPGPIAVAVDGSPASAEALAYALKLAREQDRDLTGVYVIDAGWADYIGNDWQSSRNARQGFLDYIHSQQQQQCELARVQFTEATAGYSRARFEIVVGDPVEALGEMLDRGEAELMVAGREVFQVCGRPSLKRLHKDLPRRAGGERVVLL
jgi:nucleotide-binding universal stress UspA family protein